MKIFRTVPGEGIYFREEDQEFGNAQPATEGAIVNVYDDMAYQEILGFGGAFTESAAYLYSQLTDEEKALFLRRYFDRETGLGYNFGRVAIQSCDFSLDAYQYVREGDQTLESFDISRDRRYILPFLKDALHYCHGDITLFASPWSPPAYMKDNESRFRGGVLKEEYKALWAQCYVKFIRAYEAEGVKIAAVSVQNEPNARQSWESCAYTPEQEREFIEKYLAPALDEAGLSHIKIIIWDHNKERVYDRAKAVLSSPEVEKRVWAVGHHWYTGDHFEAPRLVHERFGKVLISSEICCPITTDDVDVAERYAMEIGEDFNNFTGAFCDWNLLLSHQGGPFHNRTEKTESVAGKVFEDKAHGCYAPVLYDTEKKQVAYTPAYYYIGHFSRFVKPGARRVATTKYSRDLMTCGFVNPDGEPVLVIMNPTPRQMPVTIRHNDICTCLEMEPHSILTALLSPTLC